MKPQPQTNQAGVALVTTVIVIAVLAVVAVAFMQSTGTDRLSSRTSKNYFSAQLAAAAGAEVASAMLAGQTANDHFIVVASTNGQLFAGSGTNQTAGTFAYRPLLSFTNSLLDLVTTNTNANNTLFTSGVPSFNVPSGIRFTNVMPGGLTMTSPVVTWVYLTNTTGQTNARFVFWVEDLGGRLDLSVVGATNVADVTNVRRLTGTNPAEIALWSMFNPTANSDAGNAGATALVAARSNLLTPATARLVAPAVTADMLADLAARLRHDTNEPDVVPFGFGYADQGRFKTNINTADFTVVRSHIANNLPNFGSRGGGLASAGYLDNIAANIVDYVDADSTPTTGTGYRGVEPLPFLNERMTRFFLQGPPVNSRGVWTIKIETTDYFEFWNLHSRTSVATTVTIATSNSQPLFYSGSTNFNIVTNYTLAIPAMPPGSYFVTNTATRTNDFSITSFASPATNPIARLIGNSPTMTYTVQAAGTTYDQGRGSHYSDVNLNAGTTYFSASYPGLGSKVNIGGLADSDFLNAVGDPRSTFYMVNGGDPRPQIQPSWTGGNTSFGGRTFQSGFSTLRFSKEVLMTNWGDGGHSGTRGTAGSGFTPPALGLFLTTETNFAPARANPNINGRIDRITDLADVFDPLQWAETSQLTWPNEPGSWTNLTATATPNTAYGGGHSLRVGRPEFTRFTNAGQRSAQLMDIFASSTATNTNSGALLNRVPGRININTAGTNALRALAAGVFHTNDPLVTSGSGTNTNFVVPVAAVSAFISGVTNERAQKPFFSPTELGMITNANPGIWPASAVFGNRTTEGITAGNDAVTEEWFARVYPLSTVRSRNFLVHVVGQSLQTNDLKVLSSVRQMFQIYLEPMRDGGGRTTNSVPRMLGTWSL